MPLDAFDDTVERLRRLPGIGEKSARRLVFHLLSIAESEVEKLARSLLNVKRELRFCRRCHGLSEEAVCELCEDPDRRDDLLCLVAYPEDVFTLENTEEYRGRYHVLRGLISPLDGVGPEQLTIDDLVRRLKNEDEAVEEVIFAFNPTNEGEVTMNYLQERLENLDVRLSHLGYGLPVGSDIEYTDRMTLSKAFENRVTLDGESSAS